MRDNENNDTALECSVWCQCAANQARQRDWDGVEGSDTDPWNI